MQVSADQLRHVVEAQHDGKAALLTKLTVKATVEGETMWEGIVHIFDLEGNAKSTRAYAWSSPIDGSDKRQFYAVLHVGDIRSPLDAVRATINSR